MEVSHWGSQALAGSGRLCSGRLWQAVQALPGSGRLWQALAGSGRLWQALEALAGSEKPASGPPSLGFLSGLRVL